MTITPCNKCRFSGDCDIRREKLAGIKGLKLTAIKFICQKQRDDLPVGMKVKAALKYVAVGHCVYPDRYPWGLDMSHPDCEPWKTEDRVVDAVVMRWSGKKVRVFVPYDESIPLGAWHPPWWLQKVANGQRDMAFIHVLRVHPDQLEPTGEIVKVCHKCGLPDSVEDFPDWSCSACGEAV